jgi:photosystem II stability/assembly factor-like uncharacterized protein
MSPHDSKIVYFGTQILLKSEDRGSTWEEISPDLTRNDPEKQGRNGGPLTPENVGAEFYNTIFYIVESATEQGTIWVGSDDGLVHLTVNGGESWTDVSPPHSGEAMINAIELSPHDPGTTYLAVTGFKLNDFTASAGNESTADCRRTPLSAWFERTRHSAVCCTRVLKRGCSCHSTTAMTGSLCISICRRSR